MKQDIIPPQRPSTPSQPVPRSVDGTVRPAPRPSGGPIDPQHTLSPPEYHELLKSGDSNDLPPLHEESAPKAKPPKRRKWLKVVLIIITLLVVVLGAAVAAGYLWYQQQLSPVSVNNGKADYITIEQGATTTAIADSLQAKGLIRNSTAFMLYMRFSSAHELKAGRYKVSADQSVAQIVEHLASGKQDQLTVTFLPGDTLANHRKRLVQAGFSEADVDAALAATYQGALFAGKPTGSDLEGYIFGETYQFDAGVDAKTVLQRTFTQFEQEIKQNGLAEKFAAHGLTTFQAITLASIVQREVTIKEGDPASLQDAAKVAGVFYNRMKAGMSLGSDVTYQYAARKMGVAPDPKLDSPYNTRIHTGLPPGPISSPGIGALKAVANPAVHSYLFFLSGDDDVTYFATTDAEHEKNIQQHCHYKCSIN